MKVSAIYEKGVFRPLGKVELEDNNEVMLSYWPKTTFDKKLAEDYAAANDIQSDLKDWDAIDREGWE